MSYSNRFQYDMTEPDEHINGDRHEVFCQLTAGYVWITIAVVDGDYEIVSIKHCSEGDVTEEFKDSNAVISAIEAYLEELVEDGWYFCKLKQINKIEESNPDFIEDWIELKNGEWELHGYSTTCNFVNVIRSEINNER